MTIQSTIHRNDYIGASATATFTYSYKIFAASDLVVVQRSTADVETVLALIADYTVSGVGETVGGSITLTAGNLPTGYALAIIRRRPLLQETDIRNQGDFMPEQLEDAYDNSVMQTQSLQEQINRSITIPQSISGFDGELPVPVADKYLRVNPSGTGFDVVDLTSSAVGTIAIQNANAVAITGGSVVGITDITVADGGTGASTAQAAIDTLTAVSAATTAHVLTKDGSGNATFQAVPASSSTELGDMNRSSVNWASTTTCTLAAGGYELGGTYRSWASLLTFTFGSSGSNAGSTNLGASQTHYLYLDSSAIGATTTLTAAHFINTTTAPTRNETLGGHYNGADRCIAAFLTDGSNNLVEQYQSGADIFYADQIEDLTQTDIDTTWVDVILSAPAFARNVRCYFVNQDTTGASGDVKWRTKGQTGTVGHKVDDQKTAISGFYGNNTIVYTDSSQTIQVVRTVSNTGTVEIQTDGYKLPEGM